MRGTLTLLLAALIAAISAGDTSAQYRRGRAVQLGVKLGASSYAGDVGPAPPGTPAFDATYEFDLFYRIHRLFNVGVKHSTGGYPALAGPSDRRHSTALSIRSYFLGSRFSPYLEVGASRSYGGEKAGMGISSAIGAEIALSRRFAIFQDVSFDSVFPDDALDGSTGGRTFDVFGRIGVGIRVSLGKVPGVLRVDRVRHPAEIAAGEQVELEAVIANGRDASVEWELPGGVVYRDNPVQHVFEAPGRYEFDVVVTNSTGRIARRVKVDVSPSAEALAAAAEDSTVGIAQIETLYGPRVTVAGTQSTYRIRLLPGAAQPVEYRWEMSDGGYVEGNNIAYSFAEPGTYAIRAWVRNDVSEDSLTIAVLVDPPAGAESQSPPSEVIASGDTSQNAGAQQVVPQAAETEGVVSTDAAPQQEQPPVEAQTDSPAEAEEVAQPEQQSAAQTIADRIAAAGESEGEGNSDREVILQAPPVAGIDWAIGGYTWVVASSATREEAQRMVPEYESLGFPVGVYRDAYNGKTEYHVVVGQSASQRVAERIGVRIQRHVPRRIWLLELKR